MTKEDIDKFFDSMSQEELEKRWKKYDKYSEHNKITRFEYITNEGRQIVEYGEFEFQLQDDNRTLKVFKL